MMGVAIKTRATVAGILPWKIAAGGGGTHGLAADATVAGVVRARRSVLASFSDQPLSPTSERLIVVTE